MEDAVLDISKYRKNLEKRYSNVVRADVQWVQGVWLLSLSK